MFWIGAEPFAPGRQYLLKLGTQTVSAAAAPNLRSLDLDTLDSEPADRIALNGIADCTLRLDRPLAFDRYTDSRETGGFILIDRESFETVGMGLVSGPETGKPDSISTASSRTGPWVLGTRWSWRGRRRRSAAP
jgi:bifunctional enzyme CysN/CysC